MKKNSKRLIALLLVVLIVCAGSSVLARSRYKSSYQQFDTFAKYVSNMMKRLYTIYDYANVRNVNVFEYDFIK